jgi:catechol 2,3-dioxygenase-like lactoylglutathione lyase family enzyme
VHVADMERSIRFYERLGFGVADRHVEGGKLVWCWLEREHARLMLARADAPIDPGEQAVLFWVYTQDLDALREHLASEGVETGPITDSDVGPRRQLWLQDPDGYAVAVGEIDRARVQPGH